MEPIDYVFDAICSIMDLSSAVMDKIDPAFRSCTYFILPITADDQYIIELFAPRYLNSAIFEYKIDRPWKRTEDSIY